MPSSSSRSQAHYSGLTQYIKGLLQNAASMSLERMHQMLKIITSGDGAWGQAYDMNLIELQAFLQGLVATEQVDVVDGLYMSVAKRRA